MHSSRMRTALALTVVREGVGAWSGGGEGGVDAWSGGGGGRCLV